MSNACDNFIIKITGRCNLNCSYCYMYNMGDTTYLAKPKIMPNHIAEHSLERIYQYAEKNAISKVNLVLHGGEPLLSGKKWIKWFLTKSEALRPPGIKVNYSLQTNGTLLDEEWIHLLADYDVSVGISFDGPPEIHNRYRVDHSGRGSYEDVKRSIELLTRSSHTRIRWGVLVVANPEFSGGSLYKHLQQMGITYLDFLWPDYHHDLRPQWPEGSLAQYFKEIFDIWYEDKNPAVKVRWMVNAMTMLLSGKTAIDALGPIPLNEIVIETDGSIEPLDVLRTCRDGMTQLGLNVENHDIEDLCATEIFQTCLRNQELLPEKCKKCDVYYACGGGYMPHRWSAKSGFGNTSVHCKELLDVLMYIRERLYRDLTAAKVI